ncbi:hypothetical protein AT251_15610 [Enterovibrio nigricans]|uniref:Uncharacterized protein n=2 Tax=Enterovibrio nigricans TaxID=504469 RepID=A0A1T4V5Q0_9GAMM|nr:hypothetical protein AT251_15610 [Enterovibrio nigricans]SKA60277.1 hypothetical protein SAMN02745132_03266 [Enterovibrio nigricans DSM 22720]
MARKKPKMSNQQQHRYNDEMFDNLVGAFYESVADTVEQMGTRNIELTPSSKTGAKYSQDVAANCWRWTINKLTPLSLNTEAERLSHSDQSHSDSWRSLKDSKKLIGETGFLYGSLIVPYGIDLEVGHSSSSRSMRETGLALASMNARNNLVKLTSKID